MFVENDIPFAGVQGKQDSQRAEHHHDQHAQQPRRDGVALGGLAQLVPGAGSPRHHRAVGAEAVDILG